MSTSHSPSPELEVPLRKSKKSKNQDGKSKSKKQVTSKEIIEEDSSSESELSYQPPAGSVLLKHDIDAGEFDWDSINDDENLELWVIRVPDALKPKYLQDVKIGTPASHSTSKLGTIEHKHTSYDIWSLGEDQEDSIGGAEVKGLSCLLPRKSKGGSLFQAPKSIARHIVVTTKAELPTPDPSSGSDAASPVYKNPPRYRYPPEVLKHRFMPMGSLVRTIGTPESMDIDQVEDMLDTKQDKVSPVANAQPEVAEVVKKKRKGDEERAKKSKKTKT